MPTGTLKPCILIRHFRELANQRVECASGKFKEGLLKCTMVIGYFSLEGPGQPALELYIS